ncbi:hypothetical protein EKD04_014490 [Chloroflexales bacterium ZM16-3]|nr:hypothetical protein [Chloroflexales bacterium ZM16-3]
MDWLWWIALGALIGGLVAWVINWWYWRRRMATLQADLETARTDQPPSNEFRIERDRLSADVRTAQAERSRLDADLRACGERSDQLNQHVKALQQRVDELEPLQAQVGGLRSENARLQAESTRMQEENARNVEALQQRVGELEPLQAQVGGLRSENARLQAESTRMQDETTRNVEALQQRVGELEPLQGQIFGLRSENARLRAESTRMQDETTGLRDELDAARAAARGVSLSGAGMDSLTLRNVETVAPAPDEGIGRRDPLIDINEIGLVYEQRLFDAGVFTFEQLAGMAPEDVRSIISPESWQNISPEDWVAEAKLFAEQVRAGTYRRRGQS